MSDDSGAQRAAPLQERLENYYRQKTNPECQISSFEAISDGWETEVYAFTVKLRQQVEPMILRMYPAVDAVAKSTREFNGMGLLKSSHYPVPIVYRHETNTAWLDKPFVIMQRIDGRPLGRVMWEDPARQTARFTHLVQLMVDLHRVPIDFFTSLDEGEPADFLRRKLAFARAFIVEQSGQTWAIPVLKWLDKHLPAQLPSPLGVLHNDFHPYNVLLTPSDDAYVIDWGNIEVGDTRYDLAWTLLLFATQGHPDLRDQFLSEYEQLSGHAVENIAYFEVIAALRRLFGFVVTLTSGGESAGMRADTADIMRGQKNHFAQVYAMLRRNSGISLPEVEMILADS